MRPNTTWKPHDSGFLLTRPRKGFVGGVHAGDIGKGLGWSVGHTTDAHEGAPTSALSYTTSLRTHVTPTKPFSEPRVGSPPPVSNPSVAPVDHRHTRGGSCLPLPSPLPRNSPTPTAIQRHILNCAANGHPATAASHSCCVSQLMAHLLPGVGGCSLGAGTSPTARSNYYGVPDRMFPLGRGVQLSELQEIRQLHAHSPSSIHAAVTKR